MEGGRGGTPEGLEKSLIVLCEINPSRTPLGASKTFGHSNISLVLLQLHAAELLTLHKNVG